MVIFRPLVKTENTEIYLTIVMIIGHVTYTPLAISISIEHITNSIFSCLLYFLLIFSNIDSHILDFEKFEENHNFILINSIISSYLLIRCIMYMYNLQIGRSLRQQFQGSCWPRSTIQFWSILRDLLKKNWHLVDTFYQYLLVLTIILVLINLR